MVFPSDRVWVPVIFNSQLQGKVDYLFMFESWLMNNSMGT